jgi:branched-chain amino acid transport system substrate-binding protein
MMTRRSLCVFPFAFLMAMSVTSAFSADPGITDSSIRIGSFLPLQSGLAAGAAQYRDGAMAYFGAVNDSGGINGRKIEWLVENDSYNPQQAVAVTRKLIDRDNIFAMVSTLGTSTGLAAQPLLVQRGIPGINLSGASSVLSDPKEKNLFGLSPTGNAQGRAMVGFIEKTLNTRRIAIFYQNDQLGKDIREGVLEALKEGGTAPVAEASYSPSDVDVSAQALSISSAKPDAVILLTIPKQGSLFLLEAEKLAWKPKFIALTTMGDPVTATLAGSALNGTMVCLFTAVPGSSDPLVKQASDSIRRYSHGTEPGYWSFLGYAGAVVFGEGVRRAGRDLTRHSLITSLETLKEFETGVMPPISFTSSSHSGVKKFNWAIWQDGKLSEIEGR